jgi:hypothetical protein
MEQRPLRLGDLVDDYCPRERRLTNHAIVAIVGDEIRQTRCNTCEAEHVYKGGKVPVRKKKDTTKALYDQVLANVTAGTVAASPPPVVVAAGESVEAIEAGIEAVPATDQSPEATEPAAPVVDEGWTLHRQLIRATLPRTENHVPTPRPIPEFTMHQRNVRGSQMFRSGGHERQPGGYGMNGDGPPRGNFRGDQQPGAPGPNGPRPAGSGRRRRRSKKPRPTT